MAKLEWSICPGRVDGTSGEGVALVRLGDVGKAILLKVRFSWQGQAYSVQVLSVGGVVLAERPARSVDEAVALGEQVAQETLRRALALFDEQQQADGSAVPPT